jgi:5-methylthioadenosine/S-adenosylhomocysteine deaminase
MGRSPAFAVAQMDLRHGAGALPGALLRRDDIGLRRFPARNSIFAHCVHISEHEIQILKERGTSVSHNPVSNMMLGDGIAPVVAMRQR